MVNPQPLYIKENDNYTVTKNLFWCEQCRLAGSLYSIENCCKTKEELYPKRPCVVCSIEEQWLREEKWCFRCYVGQLVERGKLKVAEYPDENMVYCESTQKYYDDVECFFDSWDNDDARPEYLCLTEVCDMKLDAWSLVERSLEEADDDAMSRVDKREIDRLQQILDEWAELQGIKWYEETMTVWKIDWDDYDKRYGDKTDENKSS